MTNREGKKKRWDSEGGREMGQHSDWISNLLQAHCQNCCMRTWPPSLPESVAAMLGGEGNSSCSARVWSTYMTHEIQSLFPLETSLNVYNYTQRWALASICCAWPVLCCVWASNPCCRYAFKMHMQWITSLAFDRMINYLQRCCKILPLIEWLISSCVLNLAEMYEFRGSILTLNLHLPVLSVAVFGVYDGVWGVYVSDGRRERAKVRVCTGSRAWLCCWGLWWEESAKWDHREFRKRPGAKALLTWNTTIQTLKMDQHAGLMVFFCLFFCFCLCVFMGKFHVLFLCPWRALPEGDYTLWVDPNKNELNCFMKGPTVI